MIDFTEWNDGWRRHKNGVMKPGWRWAFTPQAYIAVFAVPFIALMTTLYALGDHSSIPAGPGGAALASTIAIGTGMAALVVFNDERETRAFTNPPAPESFDRRMETLYGVSGFRTDSDAPGDVLPPDRTRATWMAGGSLHEGMIVRDGAKVGLYEQAAGTLVPLEPTGATRRMA